MKKLKYVLLPIIIIGIVIAIFFIIKSNGEDNSNYELVQKAKSEILFLDSKLVFLLNSLNNITDANYYVSIQEVNQNQDASETTETTETKKENSNSNTGSSEKQQSENNQNKETKTSQMIQDVISQRNEQIDWTNLEGTLQTIYSSWSVIIIDLYKLDVNSDNILLFSKNLDETMQYVQAKDKTQSIISLANLYNYLPKFLDDFSDDIDLNTAIKVKSNIINAYAMVEGENWVDIKNEIANAELNFNALLNSIPENENSIFNINKTYIVLKELQNSIDTESKEIFYLKYRNLISELSIIQSYL